MNNEIYEIEINFSNVCTANCIICSRYHGVGNSFFMNDEVFNALKIQLKEIDFEIIQTSGNGEAFLNSDYLQYIFYLRNHFDVPIWTYNNFSMLVDEKADKIVEYSLFDKIHVRIDSLEKWIFEKNSNLNQDNVFKNLKYFLSINTEIPVVILYNNIVDYYDKCQRVLGKRPVRNYFTDTELSKVRNELDDIKEYFNKDSKSEITVFKMSHCLWGERAQAEPSNEPCPKLNVIKNVTWICPNGDVSVCCYDDRQKDFIAGNILENTLLEIWNSDKRKQIIENIENGVYTGKYPCVSPKCCQFGEGQEVKRKI